MTTSGIKLFELELRSNLARDRVETILRESPPALREKLAWITSTLADDWRRSIVSRYQIAVAIREIYEDATDNKGTVYGAKAVEAIKKVLGCDDTVIYQALHVADAFTPDQIEGITKMRLPGGKPLTYSHVAMLSRVEDDRDRAKLLKQTVKEGWTTRKLSNAVDLAKGPQADMPQERRGRPLARPKDFDAVLDQQARFAEDFLNRNEQVWSHPDHSLSTKAKNMDTTDFTKDRADRLKRHAEVMSSLAAKAKERAEETTRVHGLFVENLKGEAAKSKKIGSRGVRAKVDDSA